MISEEIARTFTRDDWQMIADALDILSPDSEEADDRREQLHLRIVAALDA